MFSQDFLINTRVRLNLWHNDPNSPEEQLVIFQTFAASIPIRTRYIILVYLKGNFQMYTTYINLIDSCVATN